MAKSYDSKQFTVTGTNFFNYSAFNKGISTFTVKNGAAAVNLFLGDTDKPAIPLAINEVYTFSGPFESLHLQVVSGATTSVVQVIEFPKY